MKLENLIENPDGTYSPANPQSIRFLARMDDQGLEEVVLLLGDEEVVIHSGMGHYESAIELLDAGLARDDEDAPGPLFDPSTHPPFE